MVSTVSFRRNLVLGSAAAATMLGTFYFGLNFNWVRSASLDYFYPFGTSPQLHLVVPATASDEQACKLLLSSGIVGFPEPVFVGWDGHGMWNGSQSHLFKISETLSYLRSLPASQDNDLVLVLDANDVWLQMPPEVLIRRYFKVIEGLNSRLKDEGLYGKTANGVQIKNSVVFGADKFCWPQTPQDAACWAVPESTMHPKIFGPDTDQDMFKQRPRWLNSGTIIGPVNDVRNVFSATMDMISRRFDEEFSNHGSDQYYFAEVWAEQEVRRTILRGSNSGGTISRPSDDSIVPDVPTDRRTEFHIAADYGSDLFLTANAYDRALTWMRYNHNTSLGLQTQTRQTLRIDEWTLPEEEEAGDLGSALPLPYSAVATAATTDDAAAAAASADNLPTHLRWSDVPLGTNAISGRAFPALHLTGDEATRARWWPRMWFHPHAEALLRAKKRQRAHAAEPDVFAVIDGVGWRAVRPPAAGAWNARAANKLYSRGGAWTDRGQFVPWDRLCGVYEDSGLFVS